MQTPADRAKKALFVTYDGLTDPLGQSQILPYLCGLAACGHRIAVLSCEKPANFATNREKVASTLAKADIQWSHVFYSKRPPVLSTVFDLLKMRRKMNQLHQAHGFDLIHCRSYLPALIAMPFKSRGVKILFDMRGFWADERVDGDLWRLSNPLYQTIYRFFKYKEARFLQDSDHIVALTHAAKTEMQRWPECENIGVKISVIPCCVDLEAFDPAKIVPATREDLRARLGIDPTVDVLIYLGSIGTWYMLDEMLAFFAQRLKRNAATLFLFVTPEAPALIYKRAELAGVPADRIVIASAKREEVPLYISLARFGVFFIRPTFSKMASSPTKQGEIMAMGLPVVCNSGVGDTDQIVQQYASGVLLQTFDDAAYESVSVQMDTIDFQSTAILAGAHDYFSLEAGISAYSRIYARL